MKKFQQKEESQRNPLFPMKKLPAGQICLAQHAMNWKASLPIEFHQSLRVRLEDGERVANRIQAGDEDAVQHLDAILHVIMPHALLQRRQ